MFSDYYMPVRVLSGKDAVLVNKTVFTKYGSKCLIVCGKSSAASSGALDDIKKVLNECEVECTVFDSVTQNPRTADCLNAGQVARDFGVEYIIGIGGGSQLDAAKAIAVYAANKFLSADGIYSEESMLPPLPVILVGTTSGTGSEVTGISVLTNESGRKKSVSGENYYAKVSFADPKYTYSMPFGVTVSTAIDAFCHAVESMLSNKAGEQSKMCSVRAVAPLWKAITEMHASNELPDKATRDELYSCSLFAGLAINLTGTCYPHTLGYTLTEDYGLPHGMACAAFLPSLIKRALEYKNAEAAEFLSMINMNYPEFERTVFSIVDIKDISMTKEQINSYCERCQSVKNFINSPGGFTAADAKAVLSELFLKNEGEEN